MTPKTLLLADDDAVFRETLARALQRRGYTVSLAANADEALAAARANPPAAAVLDLAMPGPSGLTLIAPLKALRADMRVLVLTGYASIATAVEAVKLGATNYLAKPAGASEILAALDEDAPNPETPVHAQPLSVRRLEWEHIQRVLQEHEGNISAAARALNMHRRTLQRKLLKRPVQR